MVVSGALANKPCNAGAAWTRLSWVLGLQRLECDVYFVESLAAPDGRSSEWFQAVTRRFGLEGEAALLQGEGKRVEGAEWDEVLGWADQAALLVNLSGHLALEPVTRRFRRRVFVDLDPGYTQLWRGGARLEGHDGYFTVGENIGGSDCPIPTGGIEWRPTRQPVLLSEWPCVDGGDVDRFTTVSTWRGPYGRLEHEGGTYGLKMHEFRKFLALPSSAPQTFELALDIHPTDEDDLSALREHGWRLVDPGEVAGDPDAFRRYVQSSGGEFSVAQGVYVETRSGWFSDRTTRYLASGKPALVQDTGFGRNIPTGTGLVAFRTLAEAVSGAEEIAADYDRHAQAARALAEEFFDSDKVLRRFLEEALP